MTRRIENGADFRGPLLAGGSAGTSGQVLTSAGAGAVPTWSAAGSGSGSFTASTSPPSSPLVGDRWLDINAGIQYVYFNDSNGSKWVEWGETTSTAPLLYRLDSNYVGANVSTVQSMFGVGVALSASTVYAFECKFVLTKSAGTSGHTIAILFGGTATINNIFYNGLTNGSSTALPDFSTNASSVTSNTFSSATSSPTITSATYYRTYLLSGTVSINAAGTFIPQYQLSAAPGGAYSTVAGSYVMLTPIGAAGANVSTGTWS